MRYPDAPPATESTVRDCRVDSGEAQVVILPAEDFERLARRASQPVSLVRFFAESPLAGVRVDLTRKPDYGRDIDL